MYEKTNRNQATLPMSPVYQTLYEFFTCYFLERDLEKTLELVSEDFFSVGTGEGEVAVSKSEFRRLLEGEFAVLKDPIPFEIHDYIENRRSEECWDSCFYTVVHVTTTEGIRVQYHMRNTAGVRYEKGRYFIDVLHASEASIHQGEGEFFPLKYVSDGVDAVNRKTKDDLLEIVRQIIPGGVVGGYEEEGFPLYAANEHFLKIAGYQTYEEFEKDIDGLIVNSIHPDDRDYVCEKLRHCFEYRDQYEVQYRMKKKDGTYIWVHDIGKRTRDASGRNAIISVITDISEQVARTKSIEKELARDALTGLYNRKSGKERITKCLKDPCPYMFFMIDLDNFKRVNDFYGHARGDEVLQSFARLAQASFRSEDTVCRMGGDEFAVFICQTADVEAIKRKITTLIHRYEIMMKNKFPRAESTVSAGGICSDKPYSFGELYNQADEVLYEVKKQKKGHVKIRII